MKKQIIILLTSLLANHMFATGTQKEILLNVAGNAQNDITQLYFGKDLHREYVNLEDAEKQFVAFATQIYTLSSDNVACTSNGFGDFTNTTVANFGFFAPTTGSYTFSATIHNFDETSMILLEDRITGTVTNLNKDAYTIQTNTTGRIDGRFYLYITYPISLNVTASGCTNNDGIVSINTNSLVKWNNISLVDSSGTISATVKDTSGVLTFAGLPGSSYTLSFAYNDYNFSQTTQVDSRKADISISTSSQKAAIGQDITFYSTGTNVDRFVWEFGDSGIITGVANPEYMYYEPGNYTVTVHASNEFTCTAEASLNLNVSAVTGITENAADRFTLITIKKDIIISTGQSSDTRYTCEVYDLSGQLILANPITDANATIHLNNESAGIYIVNIKSEYGNFTKKVYLD